jgi:hypothetical protein
MSIFDTLVSGMMQIEGEVSTLAREAVKLNADAILDIVRYSQLDLGILPSGRKAPFYNPATENFAKGQTLFDKSPDSRYNFQWTGETFALMDVKLLPDDEYEIFTTSGKQKLLEDMPRIGENIFQLTEKHNKFVNETIIAPFLYENILLKMVQI